MAANPTTDQERRDALVREVEQGDPEIADALELFELGAEAFTAATVEVWDPPSRVSDTSGGSA